MLWFKKKRKKHQPGHQTNLKKSIDQNQSFFPGLRSAGSKMSHPKSVGGTV